MSDCSCHGVTPRECDCLAAIAPAPSARRGGWIQTFTGRAFWPLDPRADEVNILDIAAGLSRECRFGGHCLRFYSVAEHSVLMYRAATSWNLSTKTRRAALLHDASEGLGLRDMLAPIKGHFTNYREAEAGVMSVVAERFDFDWPLDPKVKHLDMRICKAEMEQNMAAPPMPWDYYKTVPALVTDFKYWSPDKASKKFMAAAAELGIV